MQDITNTSFFTLFSHSQDKRFELVSDSKNIQGKVLVNKHIDDSN
jgi:hypothetical protein